MPSYLSLVTNYTRPNDLAEAMKEFRFLSIGETAAFLWSNPTVTSFTRDGFETGAEALEDLRGHIRISHGLLDRDDI